MFIFKLENGKIEGKEIGEKLEDLQKEVGGLIEIPFLSEELYKKGIDMIINEEGKINDLQYEAAVLDDDNQIIDIICGPILFAGHDDEGYTLGLTEDQKQFLEKYLLNWCIIETKNKEKQYHLLAIK